MQTESEITYSDWLFCPQLTTGSITRKKKHKKTTTKNKKMHNHNGI